MFDFEKLEVYRKIRETQRIVYPVIIDIASQDPELGFRLRECLFNVVSYLVDGTGRYTSEDKKRLYAESRSSLFQLVAMFQMAFDQGFMSEDEYDAHYDRFEQISKMMLGMIRTKIGTEKPDFES